MSDVTTIEADVPERYADAVQTRLRRAADEDIVGRIWRKDGTLWAPEGTPEVTNRLGWLDIAERSREQLGELEALRDELLREGYTDAVVLGMGGSSLAPEVFRLSFGKAESGLTLHVLDSTHPDEVAKYLDKLPLETTLAIVSSKSGGTIEPLSMYKAFSERMDATHFVAVTDPGSGLEQLATSSGFRQVFYGDPDIGGRYSALSAFGLVPAVVAGYDVGAVLESAIGAQEECQGEQGNAGLWLGVTLGELARAGRDKLTFVADDPLSSYGVWAEQLVAESTGKHGRGILPIADEPLLDPEAYGDDRVFLHLATDRGDSHSAKLAKLKDAGHPVITIRALGPTDLGRIFYLSEFAVAVVGWVLEINPFDQPNVQEAKDNTNRVLKEGSSGLEPGSLGELTQDLKPPAYFAIMGYLPYSAETEAAIAGLREHLVKTYNVATTWGYGPRFLHSTGQLHKGGPKTGHFLQLIDEPTQDLEVPGERFTFGKLIRAQADGDLQTLRNHGLPATRFTVGDIDAIKEQL